MLTLMLLLVSAPLESTVDLPSDAPTVEVVAPVPWTVGGGTLRGDGKRKNLFGFSESIAGGWSYDSPAVSLVAHSIDAHLSASRAVDVILGLRVVHTTFYFIPDFEPRAGLHAQLYNRGGVALGLVSQLGVRCSVFGLAPVLLPETTLTASVMVKSTPSREISLEIGAGLKASLIPYSRAGLLLPTAGFGFTVHRGAQTFSLLTQYSPVVVLGPTRATSGGGPLGTAWLTIGGNWSSKI